MDAAPLSSAVAASPLAPIASKPLELTAPPAVVAAWPRCAQLAAAFLLGGVTSLLGVHVLASVRDGCELLVLSARTVVLPETFVILERETAGIGSGATLVVIMRNGEFWCLLETDGREDFSRGMTNLYLAGTAGGEIAKGPDREPALRLKKTGGEKPGGVSWNFPFGRKGSLRVRLRLESGFGGAYFTLSEYALRPSNNESGVFRWMVGEDLNW